MAELGEESTARDSERKGYVRGLTAGQEGSLFGGDVS